MSLPDRYIQVLDYDTAFHMYWKNSATFKGKFHNVKKTPSLLPLLGHNTAE
jgi:hypothetical protein